MMISDLDILLPTGRQRLHNLLFQIRAILSSPVKARPVVMMGARWPEFLDALSTDERDRILICWNAPDVPELKGQQKVEWALENLILAPWFAYFSDDDALLPWGLEALMQNNQGVSMVMGRVLGVSRKNHLDFTPYAVNKAIVRNHCSNAGTIYKTEDVLKLERPYLNLAEPASDWEFIERMAKNHNHRIIPDVISVLTLYEMEQFPTDVQRVIKQHNHPWMAAVAC